MRSVPKDSGQSRVVEGVTQSFRPPPGANPGHSFLCMGSRLNDKDALCAPIEYAPNVSPSKIFLFKSDGGEKIMARLVRNRGLEWQPLLLNGKPPAS